jgi:predicted metal-dependent hydrolase
MDGSAIQTNIVPRTHLDFGLDGDIPRYWLAGDPFKTRFVDALSMTFPIGERFFITSVRRFRDRITDPQQLAEVRDFMRQEGQHGIVHKLSALPEAWPLVYTASVEHLTATMADMVFGESDFLDGADPRMRAVFAWHAVEEFEHKAVAFDVMQKVARVGYFTRAGIMALSLLIFQGFTLYFLGQLLRREGFPLRQRLRLWARGLWWLYRPGGVFTRLAPAVLRYFRPGFHPTDIPEPVGFQTWTQHFAAHGDPIAASTASLRMA